MRNIAICTPEISYYDAVSNDVFGMYNALAKRGYNVSIFAEVILVRDDSVKDINQLTDFIKNRNDLIVYHLSTGWFKGFEVFKSIRCKKIIKYHNITPPYFFYNFSKDHVSNCRGGIEQVRVIAGMGLDMYLNDSLFNMNEIISLGASKSSCHVVPPFNNAENLKSMRPDFDILERFNDGRTNILSVGRIAPNKGFERLIEFFYAYNKKYDPDSRLIIAGNKQTVLAAYVDYLDSKIASFNLEDSVLLPGKVSQQELKSYYLVTRIFALTSYHEGFCVPLVEAMYLKIPLVAYSSTAVTDTVGTAGVLLDKLDSNLFSSVFYKIISDEDLYYNFGLYGWERYQDNYRKEIIERKFLEAISELL